jgi:histidyl-tRNA synthetase
MGKKKAKRVEARTLKGCNDFFSKEVIRRRSMIRIMEGVFEKYGFSPLETPALEYLDTLLGTGGENTNKELFRLESPEGDEIALRFDLTVPFARMLAQYPDRIKTPFRRYAIGPSWRADKPGIGRFRQFIQCDVDVAGAATVAVDAEIIAVLAETMSALCSIPFAVLINNRKIIDALLEDCGIKEMEKHKHILRVIDKLAKVGTENVRLELGAGRIDDSGDPIPGVHLEAEVIERILAFIAIPSVSREATVEALAEALNDTPLAREALKEMRDLAGALDVLGVSQEHARFDPSLARGLDYYTGPVYEVVLPGVEGFGSVGGGGRYDGLVTRFAPQGIPCTGGSIGLDRLLAALEHVDAAPEARVPVQALVVTMGNVPLAETLRVAAELRAAGINTECFFASKKKMQMGNQLSHADHYEIPTAVIIGEDEIAQGVVSVKDLMEGKSAREDIDDRDEYRQAGKTGQVTVQGSEMVQTVQDFLSRHEA